MIRRFFTLTMTALILSAAMSGCSSEKSKTDIVNESPSSQEEAKDELTAFPVLKISNTEGKPGETVNVTVSLEGAENSWSACGIHFSYDEALECVTDSDDDHKPVCVTGRAIENMSGFQAALWLENKTEELEENNLNSLFFCSISTGDFGRDGNIATFQFIIPKDAEVGTKYNLDFFEQEEDMFLNSSSSKSLREYAFTNWLNGSITVI